MEYTILVVDDEKEIRELVRLYLENEHYQVIEAEDGQQALETLRRQRVDLCILDIMMPKMDGYHVLREMRKDNNIPVLILSAKDADSEKILGLNLGADDYMAKPFNPLELVARVNSNIRRFYSLGTSTGAQVELKVKDLTLNAEACELRKGDTVLDLTSVEYRIMELFMKHPGKVYTKQQIYEYGWGEAFIVADNNFVNCYWVYQSENMIFTYKEGYYELSGVTNDLSFYHHDHNKIYIPETKSLAPIEYSGYS